MFVCLVTFLTTEWANSVEIQPKGNKIYYNCTVSAVFTVDLVQDTTVSVDMVHTYITYVYIGMQTISYN